MKSYQIRTTVIACMALSLIFASCQNKNKMADMIIMNARIWTGNSNQPWAEAMAIGGDSILVVGNNNEVLKWKNDSTNLHDLKGLFVTPGFIDSHVHFVHGGFNLSSVQLRDASTKEVFIQRIAEYAKTLKPGEWITGGDWDNTLWGGELPDRSWIDAATTDHPVFVNRLDGHMSVANSLAIKLAGIDGTVRDIEGGTIGRDASGKLTGIFKDNAIGLIESTIPHPSAEQTDKALIQAMNYVASKGVTSVHHMCGDLDAIERARDNHSLITRIYVMFPIEARDELRAYIQKNGKGDKWLQTGGVKGFVDGSLGSRTAAFLSPYLDAPKDSGFFVNKEEELFAWTLEADKEGFQVMIHAIGDRANHYLLDMYDSVAKVNGPRDRRFRIEHAQHLARGDVSRFAKSGIIASMQPYHAIDDGRWAEKVIGSDRSQTTYAFKSLFDSGAVVTFGSDWYVAPPTPLEGIYAAVTRRTLDEKNPDGWVPAQKISVEQALTAYTKNGAYSSFEEDIKGTLAPGKLADFVVISEDLTNIDPVKIREARILQTWVGGKLVYDGSK